MDGTRGEKGKLTCAAAITHVVINMRLHAWPVHLKGGRFVVSGGRGGGSAEQRDGETLV